MSYQSVVPPQLHILCPSQQMNDTFYEQYRTDKLYHTHIRSREAFDSFSTYHLQPDLPSFDTNVNSHVPNRKSPSHSHAVLPHAPHASSMSINYQEPYVTTLRKQKATVWCEHSQAEDPRIMAALRTAKARAILEVTGSSSMQDVHNQGISGIMASSPASSVYRGASGHGVSLSSQGSTKPSKMLATTGLGGGVHTVRKKTWVKERSASNHGGSKRIVMEPGSLIVGAVPVRLSASEVAGDSGDDDADSVHRGHSTPRTTQYGKDGEHLRQSLDGLHYSNSTGSKSSTTSSAYSVPRSITREPELVPFVTTTEPHANAGNPFSLHVSSRGSVGLGERLKSTTSILIAPEATQRAASGGSSSNSSSSSMVETLSPLPTGLGGKGARVYTSELQRQGSVDEREARTRTMSGVRLFVANPDAH